MSVLEHATRKQMSVTIVRSVLKGGTLLQEVEQVLSERMLCGCFLLTCSQVDLLLTFISLLIKDDDVTLEMVRSLASAAQHISSRLSAGGGRGGFRGGAESGGAACSPPLLP